MLSYFIFDMAGILNKGISVFKKIYLAIKEKGFRYLCVGGINTLFGYVAGLVLYYALRHQLHIVIIGILCNIVCITFSYTTCKFIVFRTKGNYFIEYLRCYVVYGGTAMIGIAGLWFFVDILHMPYWLASLGLMGAGVVLSFIGHDRFTFRQRNTKSKISIPPAEIRP